MSSKANCLTPMTSISLPSGVDVLTIKFPENSSMQLAVGCSDGRLRLFNTSEPFEHVATLMPKPLVENTVTVIDADPCVAISFLRGDEYKNQILAAYSSGCIRRWHIGTKSCLSQVQTVHPGTLLTLDLCSDDVEYAAAGESTYVEMFDLTSKTPKGQLGSGKLRRYDPKHVTGHSNRIHCVRYHPTDPNIIFSSGWDTMLLMWDKTQESPLKHVSGLYICGEAIAICVESNKIFTGSFRPNDSLQCWSLDLDPINIDSKTSEIAYRSDISSLYVCQVHPKYNHILAVGGIKANELRIVDIVNGHTIGRVTDNKGLYTCRLSDDGNLLVGGGASGRVWICSIEVGNHPMAHCLKTPAIEEDVQAARHGTTWEKVDVHLDNDAGFAFDLSDHDNDSDVSDSY